MGTAGTEIAAITDVVGRLTEAFSTGAVPLGTGAAAPLVAVTTVQELQRLVDRLMRIVVDGARTAGHTWQELGDMLGTTRQAAFQRFGRPTDPRTGRPMTEAILPGAADRAVELLANLIKGRWQDACRDFDDTVAARLDSGRLAAVWAQLVGVVGRFDRIGKPRAYQAGDYTIVDTPLLFEAGDLTGRISYDRAGRVAGLHFLPPGPANPARPSS